MRLWYSAVAVDRKINESRLNCRQCIRVSERVSVGCADLRGLPRCSFVVLYLQSESGPPETTLSAANEKGKADRIELGTEGTVGNQAKPAERWRVQSATCSVRVRVWLAWTGLDRIAVVGQLQPASQAGQGGTVGMHRAAVCAALDGVPVCNASRMHARTDSRREAGLLIQQSDRTSTAIGRLQAASRSRIQPAPGAGAGAASSPSPLFLHFQFSNWQQCRPSALVCVKNLATVCCRVVK